MRFKSVRWHDDGSSGYTLDGAYRSMPSNLYLKVLIDIELTIDPAPSPKGEFSGL